jgi:hypothetical protein
MDIEGLGRRRWTWRWRGRWRESGSYIDSRLEVKDKRAAVNRVCGKDWPGEDVVVTFICLSPRLGRGHDRGSLAVERLLKYDYKTCKSVDC